MAVGIDIGSKTIKIVELVKEGNGWKLTGSGIVAYSGKSPEHMAEEKELAQIGSLVKKLHSEARISRNEIALALPETQVFTRTIRFPLLTEGEIASAVKWEAEQYIPIPLAEAIVQHQIIERRENSTPPEVLVLLIAAPRAVIEKYTKIIQFAGLVPTLVETELMALVRALGPMDKTALLVDFGARSTDIAISKNGNLVFSRSLNTAGDAFTRAVAQGLAIEETQAEEYKKTYGLAGQQLEGKVRAALSPVVTVVTDEIKKAIHYYQTEEKGESPQSIILSGGSAGMPDVASVLTKLFGLEVVLANPFANIKLDPAAAQNLSAYAPLYSIAVGLAMAGD